MYKYRFYSIVISSRGEVFNQLNRTAEQNLKCRIPEKIPSVFPVFKRHYLSSAQKLAAIQNFGSAFSERIREVQNPKNETYLLKIVDCFIDSYGFLINERISFSINNLKLAC